MLSPVSRRGLAQNNNEGGGGGGGRFLDVKSCQPCRVTSGR